MTIGRQLDSLILAALDEDLQGGDITTEATISAEALATARAVAKAPLVVSGTEVFSRTFFCVDPTCRVESLVADGTLVEAGTPLLQVDGPARSILIAERTALNFMQRLSGTATLTRRFVDAADGRVRIADTRKTTPGLRNLEREAVRHGGGHNHRANLGAAVMIKDNHIAAAGGITAAVERARAHAPHTCKIEVEVTTEAQLDEALSAGAEIVMLDNFTDDAVKALVEKVGKRAIVEVSGNMSEDRIALLCRAGVDVISVGALTHSAPAADISLRLMPAGDALMATKL